MSGRQGLERALLDAYAAHFFTRFGQEKTGSVHYEQEYLLQGNASERENLKRTVNELLAVREAVNLALYMRILKNGRRRKHWRWQSRGWRESHRSRRRHPSLS